jgi:hypothetical protein
MNDDAGDDAFDICRKWDGFSGAVAVGDDCGASARGRTAGPVSRWCLDDKVVLFATLLDSAVSPKLLERSTLFPLSTFTAASRCNVELPLLPLLRPKPDKERLKALPLALGELLPPALYMLFLAAFSAFLSAFSFFFASFLDSFSSFLFLSSSVARLRRIASSIIMSSKSSILDLRLLAAPACPIPAASRFLVSCRSTSIENGLILPPGPPVL